MRKFEYFDPYEAKDDKSCTFSEPSKINGSITNPEAIALWNEVMREARSLSDRKKVLLRRPSTASMSFAGKIQQFLDDKEGMLYRFDEENVTIADIYKAAKFSKSKWCRIMSGKLLDIERGNAFSIAIALHLNVDETEELLYSAGFAINYELDLDAAMMFYIRRQIYDLDRIYATLSCFSDIKNGLDCFAFKPQK